MDEKRQSTLEMRRKLEAYKNAPLPKRQSEPMPSPPEDLAEVIEAPVQEEEKHEGASEPIEKDDTVLVKKKAKKAPK